MTIAELQEKVDFLDWRAHFEDAMRAVKSPKMAVKISEKERIVVYAPKFLEDLSALVKEYNRTMKGKM